MTLNVSKIINDMQEEQADLVITTGGTGGYKEPKPLPTPVQKMNKYAKENNIRLSDLFIVYDKQKRSFLTETDFRASLKVWISITSFLSLPPSLPPSLPLFLLSFPPLIHSFIRSFLIFCSISVLH